MTKASNTKRIWLPAAVVLLVAGLGCSTKSPTAPQQTPAPPPGTQVSATWIISVEVSSRELIVGTTESATVSIRVRRLDDNQPPPSGSTIVLFTTLGEFDSPGSGVTSVVLRTFNGRAEVQFFPGSLKGSALLTAQLEASAGQASVKIVDAIEPVVAQFDFENSQSNLSVQFRDTSTGDPDKFRWDFGDGKKSRERNPSHLYAAEGDYVVTLTASKTGSEDTVTRIVTVTVDPDEVVEADFEFVIEDRTVVFQDLSTGNPTSWSWDFGDGGRSSAQNPSHTYASAGSYVVTLTARNRHTEDSTSKIVTVEEGTFITDITPNAGPAGGGTAVVIRGQGFVAPLRVFFGDVKATVTSSSSSVINVVTPPGVLLTEACDDDNDTIQGTRSLDTAVVVKVELQSGATDEVSGGFVYLASGVCVGD